MENNLGFSVTVVLNAGELFHPNESLEQIGFGKLMKITRIINKAIKN